MEYLFPPEIYVRPEKDKQGRFVGHVVQPPGLYCQSEDEILAWLRAGGYIYREDVTQPYTDRVHGLYQRYEINVLKDEGNKENLVEWAASQAIAYLTVLEARWLHVQSVVGQARVVGQVLNEDDCATLVAAAYLHDIGYAPTIRKTGFHPLDGAMYLRSLGEERLACLVAHHSEARFEAALRGYARELAAYPREQSAVADALIYCDMMTGPTGQRVSFEERIADIFARYGEANLVTHAIRQALPTLALAVSHTLQLIQQGGK